MRCGGIERDILIDTLGNLELRSSSGLSSSRKGKKRRPIEKEGKGRKRKEKKGKGKERKESNGKEGKEKWKRARGKGRVGRGRKG